MNPISSRDNDKFKTWLSLLSSKGIKKEGLFLLSGERLIKEFLKKPNLEISAELVPKGHEKLTDDRKNIFEFPIEMFASLDELGTRFNILVLKTPKIPTWSPQDPAQQLEVFCPLGDPNNVGALLRCAEAFGADQVILTEESANPFLPKSVKASAGSVLRVNLVKGPKVSELPSDLIALDGHGQKLNEFKWPTPCRIIVGEEGQGLKSFQGQNRICITTKGVESLNASVAIGIALYDFTNKKGLKF